MLPCSNGTHFPPLQHEHVDPSRWHLDMFPFEPNLLSVKFRESSPSTCPPFYVLSILCMHELRMFLPNDGKDGVQSKWRISRNQQRRVDHEGRRKGLDGGMYGRENVKLQKKERIERERNRFDDVSYRLIYHFK